MVTHASHARGAAPSPKRRPVRDFVVRHEKRLLVGIVSAVVLAIAIARVHGGGSEQEAITRMPDGERAVLYQRLAASTEMVCARAEIDPVLARRCRDSAEFLRAFPECDQSCRNLAEIVPTR
jgi:hypothetical protein